REEPARTEKHFTHRQAHRKHAAVFAHSSYFASDANDPRFAGAKVAQKISIVLATVRLGHQQLDVAAHQFRLNVAKEPLRRRIGRLNDAVLVNGNDRVDGSVNDSARSRVALTKGLLR